MSATEPILRVRDLVKHYPARGLPGLQRSAKVQAVNGISFDLLRGTTLGIVGESGSGKSTTARVVMGLTPPTSGLVEFEGSDITTADRASQRRKRMRMQMIFQDPRGSLDPRMRVRDVIGEGLIVHRLATRSRARSRVAELLEMVGLRPADADKFAHEFSGGQAQRIAIARALATAPDVVVCDEAVSALDVSVQAQIVNLLRRLQEDLGLSYLFISHDLNIVRYMSDHLMVMYLGQVVEEGPSGEIFGSPQHPYTRALLATTGGPTASPTRLVGEIPNPASPPTGCRFHTRCPVRIDRCSTAEPELTEIARGQRTACHLVTREVLAR